MMRVTCEKCTYAVKLMFDRVECRRYPPAEGLGNWPRVYPDNWCGEAVELPDTRPPREITRNVDKPVRKLTGKRAQ